MFNVSYSDESSILELLTGLMLTVKHLAPTGCLSRDFGQSYLSHNNCFDADVYAKTHSISMTENFVKSFTIHEDDKLLITDLQTDYQQITESLLYVIIQTHSNLTTAFLKLV